MNKIVEELKKAKVFYIATIDEDMPRVRPFGSVMEFEGNVYICSGNFKVFYKQIEKNPNVELSSMLDQVSWIRVSATLIEDNRKEVQEAMLADPTGPKGLYQALDGRFVTFKMTNIKAKIYSFVDGTKDLI